MSFECTYCGYITNKKSNYDRHIGSNSHINKMKTIISCEYCGATFAFSSGLRRHRSQYCKLNKNSKKEKQTEEKIENDKDDKFYKILIANTELMSSITKSNNDVISAITKNSEVITKTNETTAKAIVNATEANVINAKTTKKSMNMLKYANEHMKTAPPLKKLGHKEIAQSIEYFGTDLKKLEYNKNSDFDYESDNYDFEYEIGDSEDTDNSDSDIDNKGTNKKDNKKEIYNDEVIIQYAEIIISHHTNKTLRDFIGEIIKHCRHKTDPNSNSFWETDIQRLHFIVKYEGPTYNKSVWIKDECGTIIKDVVITNLCNDIRKILKKYVKILTKKDNIFLSDKNCDLGL